MVILLTCPWWNKRRVANLTLADTRNLRSIQPVSPFVDPDFSFKVQIDSDENSSDGDQSSDDDDDNPPGPKIGANLKDDSLNLNLSDSTSFNFSTNSTPPPFFSSFGASDTSANADDPMDIDEDFTHVRLDGEKYLFAYLVRGNTFKTSAIPTGGGVKN